MVRPIAEPAASRSAPVCAEAVRLHVLLDGQTALARRRSELLAELRGENARLAAELASLRAIESAARAALAHGQARYDAADGATRARVIQAARAWAAARDAAWADFAPGPQMRAYEDAGDVLAATVAVMDRRVDDEGQLIGDEGQWIGDLVPAAVVQALRAVVHGEQAAVMERPA